MAFFKELNGRVVGAPSILAADFANLAEEVRKAQRGRAELVHFDVMDNHFVPNLTVGQYLRPTENHLPMSRYYAPKEFAELKKYGLSLGFKHVESGPLVRSSYHAHEQTEDARSALGASV